MPHSKTYLVKRLPQGDWAGLEKALATSPRGEISTVNWPEYGTEAQVSFQAGYNGQSMAIRFSVLENGLRAKYLDFNEPIYEDCCVEFFLATAENEYVNFEFNCIGNALSQRGASRHGRTFLPDSDMKRISTYPSLERKRIDPERAGEATWTLGVLIPLDLLRLAPNPQGRHCRANFYKCGDGLAQPHYLTWNPVKTDNPDYHRPEFFGTLIFES